VQSIDSSRLGFVRFDAASTISDTQITDSAASLAAFPAGLVLVRAWVNGVPGVTRHTVIAATPGQPASVSASGGVFAGNRKFHRARELDTDRQLAGHGTQSRQHPMVVQRQRRR
jgi:hypothetical protein